MSRKLKRFSDAKYAQVEQLISYSQLLGLTGADLVSIGGRMQREAKQARKLQNMRIIEGFVCLPVGRKGHTIDQRFKIDGPNNHYRFENRGSDIWHVINTKNRKVKTHYPNPWDKEIPRAKHWSTMVRYAMLLDVASGMFKLDF
jgi:hypothetical protein